MSKLSTGDGMTPLSKEESRRQFLIAMYNQLTGEINRHIVVIWHSIGVLGGTFAALSLVEKGFLPLDFAVAFIVLLCAWVGAHVVDSAYWYNRNLVIIANIERVFLYSSDARNIHYYFTAHRKSGSMLTHLKLQLYLAISIASFALLGHVFSIIIPVLSCRLPFAWINLIPWVVAVLGAIFVLKMRETVNLKYSEFLEKSPGLEVGKLEFEPNGPGHPSN